MSADAISNLVAFPRNSGTPPCTLTPESEGRRATMRKDCSDALALIAEAVESLEREVHKLSERLRTRYDVNGRELALKRLQEVRDQLETTRLRTQCIVAKVFTTRDRWEREGKPTDIQMVPAAHPHK